MSFLSGTTNTNCSKDEKSISNVFKMSFQFLNENGITFRHNLIPSTPMPYVGKVTESVCLLCDTSYNSAFNCC